MGLRLAGQLSAVPPAPGAGGRGDVVPWWGWSRSSRGGCGVLRAEAWLRGLACSQSRCCGWCPGVSDPAAEVAVGVIGADWVKRLRGYHSPITITPCRALVCFFFASLGRLRGDQHLLMRSMWELCGGCAVLRANAVRQMAWSGLGAVKVERISAFAEGRAVASGCHWQPWWLCGACDAGASACVHGLVWRCPCVL